MGRVRVGLRMWGAVPDILRSQRHLPFMFFVCLEYNLSFPILGNPQCMGPTEGDRPLSPVSEHTAQLSQCLDLQGLGREADLNLGSQDN